MSFRGMLLKAGINVSGGVIDIGQAARVVTAGGIPIIGGVFGNAWFVDYRNGVDTNTGKTPGNAFKTYGAAIDACASNNNDTIFIDGDSTVVEAAMVTISKNRVHSIGVNGAPGHYGAGAKISCSASATASNVATVKNTGVRNTFTGIKFVNEMTVAEGLYGFLEGGEYSRFNMCEFYKFTDLNVTGASEFVQNGDSPMFYNCTFGSSANDISGAIIRANILFTKGLAGTGTVSRDAWFENCILWRKSSNSANRFVYGANATDIERMCVFKECLFMNNKLSAGTPAQNVAFGATLTVGEVLLWDCASMNAGTAMSTTTGVFILGYTPDATGAAAGIGIQGA